MLDVGGVPVFLELTEAGQLGFLVVAVAHARLADVRVPVSIPDRREGGYVVGGTVDALCLAAGLSVFLSYLGLAPGSVVAEAARENPALLPALAILSMGLVAPAEEFLVRGVIQSRLRRAFRQAGATSGASRLFGFAFLAT